MNSVFQIINTAFLFHFYSFHESLTMHDVRHLNGDIKI